VLGAWRRRDRPGRLPVAVGGRHGLQHEHQDHSQGQPEYPGAGRTAVVRAYLLAHSGTGEVGIVVPFRGVYRTEGSGRIGGTLLWCLTPGRLSAAGATNVLGTDDHGRTRGSSTAAASTRAPTAPAVTGGHSSLRTEVAGAR
jgi:hypothetical protein